MMCYIDGYGARFRLPFDMIVDVNRFGGIRRVRASAERRANWTHHLV